MTPDQIKDQARLSRYIEREGLAPVMSNTKWQRLCDALSGIEGVLEFRRKDVRELGTGDEKWTKEFRYMLSSWRSIEWLDIRAQCVRRRGALVQPQVEDFSDDLLACLSRANTPFSRHDYGVRVWGYIRPGVSPNWET